MVTVERLSAMRPGQQRKVFGKRELLGLARYDRGVRVDSPRGSEASFASSVLVGPASTHKSCLAHISHCTAAPSAARAGGGWGGGSRGAR